ncbi:MAG TPA: hypothetical protein GX400_02525 [Chloroflexi bacterium]|nr:hypothetical protein [Chloroflexota bacterium]
MTSLLWVGLWVLVFTHPVAAQSEGVVYLPAVLNDYTVGWHWRDAYTVTVATRTTNLPLAAIDHEGQPHIFWYHTLTDDHVHHLYLTLTGWQATLAPAPADSESLLTNAPLVDDAGRVHLLWFNRLPATEAQRHRFLHATFSNGVWQSPREIMRSKYSTINGWLRLGADDQPRVAVTDGFLGWRAMLYSLGGEWQAQSEVNLPADTDIVWPDAVDGAHLYGASNGTLQYWRWSGGTVGAAQALGSGALLGRSLAFDAMGNLHIFWKAGVNVEGRLIMALHHQCIDALPQASEIVYPGGAATVSNVVGASENGPLFALAWQEPNRKRLMLWDGCTPGATVTIPEDVGERTTLRAVAVSSTPRKVCVFMQQDATDVYTVRCADLD